MNVRDVAAAVESIAPRHWAADWDNVGLLVGDADAEVQTVLLCVDVTAAVLKEAADRAAGLIVAHHPLIFKGLRSLTPAASPLVYEAVRRGIAIYAAHTNFDAAPGGTNDALAEAIGLVAPDPLVPVAREGQLKLVVFTPLSDLEAVCAAAFNAGAGRIGNYERCSFYSAGTGTFRGGEDSDPTVGQAGRDEQAEELRLEIIVPRRAVAAVCAAVREAHSYEEPAMDVYPLLDVPAGVGDGRWGRYPQAVRAADVIERLKDAVGTARVLVAGLTADRKVRTAGVCAGSGKSFLSAAARGGVELLVTGEVGHHDAVDYGGVMTIVNLGHGTSERPGMQRLTERLSGMLPDLHVQYAAADREPFEVV